MAFKEKQYSLFAFFSGLQGNFSSMLAPKSEASCRQCFPRGNERPFPKPTGVLQDGSCLTTASILPKAPPLDSKRAFGATLLTLSKRQERQMEKRKATNRFQRRRTLRLTAEEDERITRQAETAGISVSEYMRRLFFGGRPIIARTDDQTIRELRRLGGLLKHHFEMVKRTGNPATLSELDAALREIRRAIEALSERR